VRKEFQHLYQSQDEIKESQDICFIPDNDYKVFVSQFVPPRKGVILSVDGKQLGYHEGIQLFTIGQRRGINIPYKEPLYVVNLNPIDNAVIVGPKECLKRTTLEADEINLLASITHGRAHAKVRYRQNEQPCSFTIDNGIIHIDFDEPVLSVTPGQSVVLYEGDTVLGGGTIQ
jgi:tRNA-specific 2-thiouridylase